MVHGRDAHEVGPRSSQCAGGTVVVIIERYAGASSGTADEREDRVLRRHREHDVQPVASRGLALVEREQRSSMPPIRRRSRPRLRRGVRRARRRCARAGSWVGVDDGVGEAHRMPRSALSSGKSSPGWSVTTGAPPRRGPAAMRSGAGSQKPSSTSTASSAHSGVRRGGHEVLNRGALPSAMRPQGT